MDGSGIYKRKRRSKKDDDNKYLPLSMIHSFSSNDSDWDEDETDTKKSKNSRYNYSLTDSVEMDQSQLPPPIPTYARNLFDYDMTVPTQIKCTGKSCDPAYMTSSGICFHEDQPHDSTNRKRIKVEVLRFVMDSIDEVVPTALDEIEKEISDAEARKVVNVQYDRHVNSIKSRVRDRLAQVKIPNDTYSRGVDNVKLIAARNRYHVKTIQNSQHLTENFEYEIEKQQNLLNRLRDQNSSLKSDIETYQFNLNELQTEGKMKTKYKLAKGDDEVGAKPEDEMNSNLSKDHCSLKSFMKEIISPYDDII